MNLFYSCDDGWFGEDCSEPCVNGQMNPIGSQNCECDPGWVGTNCDVMCSFHGVIENDKCQCDTGWRGTNCDIPGCPGETIDCTGHGHCNAQEHVCTCDPGWTGVVDGNGYLELLTNACDVPDCPGQPDCAGVGECDATLTVPKCKNCEPGWMGEACEDICDAVHGEQVPMNSGICVCDSCYTGKGCNEECSNHGMCEEGTCNCTVGWRGTKCEVPGCPGESTDCTGHGKCNTATHICTCLPGKYSITVNPFIFAMFYISLFFHKWAALQIYKYVKCFIFNIQTYIVYENLLSQICQKPIEIYQGECFREIKIMQI